MSRATLNPSIIPATAWKWIVGLMTVAALDVANSAGVNLREMLAIHSRSDQFVVTAPAPNVVSYRITRRDFKYDPNALHLEAPALAVTCERVKNAMLRELGMTDKWRGRVFIMLRPAATVAPEIIINSNFYADGWQYRMEIPDQVDPERLIRGLVQVILLEMANRSAGSRPAEIPVWLMEGFTTVLAESDGQNLILQTEKLDDLRVKTFPAMRLPDPLKQARQRLTQQAAFSFADLCLPSQAQLSGVSWENYRYNSQLLVTELLRIKDGGLCMQEFIALLPSYLNHQLAFLQAFHGRFNSMLEMEKWWSVTLANFSGRDQQLKWSPYVCLQRLDEILRAPVEVRASTNSIPAREELRLQGIFEKLDYQKQKLILQNIANQLQQLQWAAPPDMYKLVTDYHTALITYLQKRHSASGTSEQKGQTTNAKIIIRDTIKQLDRLDVIRDDFRNFDATAGPTTAQTR